MCGYEKIKDLTIKDKLEKTSLVLLLKYMNNNKNIKIIK